MTKAAIFDLNGVLIQSPHLSERFERSFNVKEADFLAVLKKIMNIVRKPNAPSVYELFYPHLKTWNITFSKQKFLDYWFSAEEQNEKFIHLALDLQNQGFKIFILSNNFRERSEYYAETFDFLKAFDQIYYSWQTGFTKPNEQCWLQIIKEHDLNPKTCIYFDDSFTNVNAAQSLGISAINIHNIQEGQDLKQTLKLIS